MAQIFKKNEVLLAARKQKIHTFKQSSSLIYLD